MKFQELKIKASDGEYKLEFVDNAIECVLACDKPENLFFLVDEKIWSLYPDVSNRIEKSGAEYLLIHASEAAKSYGEIEILLDKVLEHSFKRGQKLVAVGGGITQDIVGFIASIVYRGVPWIFVPTSLLSQADSCIGSKTSINLGRRKNALGTFHHPESIYLDLRFLGTLSALEIQSGIGEMLKVHIINSIESFNEIAQNYELLRSNQDIMLQTIFNSLFFKKGIIQQDEKDTNIRLVMNYGHTFGHAIEVASQFRIPHGLAVTLGMDTANYISTLINSKTVEYYDLYHPVLMANLNGLPQVHISKEDYFMALLSDKKNTPTERNFVLLNSNGLPTLQSMPVDSMIPSDSYEYLVGILKSC
ncbi:3-dehydroquinate synthase family protein [Candidatus Planktophila dulcis]|uniref:3-dehydroquinate synthase family protein n=1 Tax=Candidatus Planktophila dulcis TaxID=1884914 RepID=UPI003CF236C6